MTENLSTEEHNVIWSLHLVRALEQSGVRHFVVSSGSRCSPLVLAVAHCTGIHIWTQIDERSAGFWGLGIGKASHVPAAIICTSGTAAANYLPAVIEARLSHTPLIVLSADRPIELRDKGAPQTIDQMNLYGRYPLFFRDLPAPEGPESGAREWAHIGARAASTSLGPPCGPVHLNVAFREPLIPDPRQTDAIVTTSPSGVNVGFESESDDKQAPAQWPEIPGTTWDEVAEQVARARRGLIVCGPQNSCDDLGNPIAALAAATGLPVLADIASQVRFGMHDGRNVISHYDLCLRDHDFAERLSSDLVIRFGGLPTSKTLNEWLAARPCEQILIDDHDNIADPYGSGTLTVVSDLKQACQSLTDRMGTSIKPQSAYLSTWQTADAKAAEVVRETRTQNGEIFEGDVVGSVFRLAQAGMTVVLSNSMPIRLAEFYATGTHSPVRVLCSRGANGIDGVVSTAGGVAASLESPVVLVIGDVAMIHDLNGLLEVRRRNLPLKIVLLNNDGGGIFSFLPIAAHRDFFEPLVAMPHGRDFAHAAAFHGIPCRQITSQAEFDTLYARCFSIPGPELLEIRTDRSRTLALSREIERSVAARIGGST